MTPLLNSIIIYTVVALFGGIVGWGVNGWRMESKVAQAKEDFNQARVKAWEDFLGELLENQDRMADAAEDNRIVTADLDKNVDKIVKELRNAKPLPPECRLDDFRMQHLAAAVADLQRTLAGSKSGAAVHDTGAAK